MILGISEDFSSSVTLDSQLKAAPSSGLYVNTGVHPCITIDNLLHFLPKLNFTFSAWSDSANYGVFLTSRNRSDIVTQSNKVYESIKASTSGDPKDPVSEPTYWVETNIESLRLKLFIQSVKDRVLADLNINKRLVNNQYIYGNGDVAKTLENNFSAWVIEAKGSDYVAFRVNQVSLKKSGTTPVNLYVVNEGVLLDTIQIAPSNGNLNFVDTNIALSGKGRFYLAIDSTEVLVSHATVDPLKFDGFVVYTATGTGVSADVATYSHQTTDNGIGLNITAYLDASQYITNNLQDFGPFIRATFEYMTFQMFESNPNNRSNRNERIQMTDEVLAGELRRMDGDTVARRYHNEKKRAMKMLEKTFDTQLGKDSKFEVKTSSV